MKGGLPTGTDMIDRIGPSSSPHFSAHVWTSKDSRRSSRPINVVNVEPAFGRASATNFKAETRDRLPAKIVDLPLETFDCLRIECDWCTVMLGKFIIAIVVSKEMRHLN